MKLKFLYFLLPVLVLFMMPASANATATVLPEVQEGCPTLTEFKEYWGAFDTAAEVTAEIGVDAAGDMLGCAIQLGYIKAWMVPFFVTYILQFLLGIAGLISVLMILLGAYYYIAGGLSDDKEKGKTIVQYAILGLVITSVSWILVNIVLLAVTQ
ncbi:MAG: hypothetical protein AAB802_01195 [Patescibacteria group bacterium]